MEADGTVVGEIALPAAVAALQRSNGFEGVAVTGSGAAERVFVAFQREWTGDPARRVRIGEYRRRRRVALLLLSARRRGVAGGRLRRAVGDRGPRRRPLLVLERDNVGRARRAHQALYAVSIAGVAPSRRAGRSRCSTKTLVRDLLPALRATPRLDAGEGRGSGRGRGRPRYIVTDNDGVDENTGETQFIRLGNRNRLGF